jgi:hypothetical protein
MGSRTLRRQEENQNDQDKAALLSGSLEDLLQLSRRIGMWLSNPGQGPITIDGREILLIQESLCILICEGLANRLAAEECQAVPNRPLTSRNHMRITPEETKDDHRTGGGLRGPPRQRARVPMPPNDRAMQQGGPDRA